MPPSRSRPSRGPASSRPAPPSQLPTQSTASGLLAKHMRTRAPIYEPPTQPLTPKAQQDLAALATRFRRRNMAAKHAAALKQLGQCVYDIQNTLRNLEDKVASAEKKAEERGPEAAKLDMWRDRLAQYQPRQTNLAGRIEKYARTCVDLDERHVALLASLDAVVDVDRAGGGGGQQVGRRKNTQGAAMSSFEPTLPGTEDEDEDEDEDGDGDVTMAEPVESLLEGFQAKRDSANARWRDKTLIERYGEHRGFAEFKESEYEGYHGDDEECPPPSRWFATEEPAPGTATQGAADDSDDDLQVAKTKISTKCPLTLREFIDPVMSKSCKHTFEKSAIFEMLGSRPHVQCPVGGCPHQISRSQLQPNDKLIRKIKRIQHARRRTRDTDVGDETERQGANVDDSIVLSDGPEVGGFQSLEAVAKEEEVSQSVRRRGEQEQGVDDVTDGDTDDE